MLKIQIRQRWLIAAAMFVVLSVPALAHSRHHPVHILHHRVHRPAHGHRRGGERHRVNPQDFARKSRLTKVHFSGSNDHRFGRGSLAKGVVLSDPPPSRGEGGAPRIILEAEKFLGEHNPTHFIGPWCGAFAGLVTRIAGDVVPKGYLLAWNWIHAGPRLPGPRPGAYAVRKGHVALVKAVIGRRVVLINGNFNHRVAESIEPIGRFVYVAPRRS